MLRPLPLRFSLATLALLGIVLGARFGSGPSEQLRLIMPPLPGDGALLLLPDGRSLLIDGGADGAALSTWLGNTLPFGARRIDALVLTRADASTLPGQLAALKRYAVGAALLPPTERRSSSLDAWRQLLEEQGTIIKTATAGDGLQLGACTLRVMAEHAGRATLGLRCGAAVVYFWQSLDDEGEVLLARQPVAPAAAVVYPWGRSTQTALLDRAQPQRIVFGEGGDATLKLTWIERQRAGAQLLHEAVDGQIELRLDGPEVTLKTGLESNR